MVAYRGSLTHNLCGMNALPFGGAGGIPTVPAAVVFSREESTLLLTHRTKTMIEVNQLLGARMRRLKKYLTYN